MKILFVVAHPDDEVLGCGGTIARFTRDGHEVYIAILGEWNLSPQLPDSAFTLEIPEGVERVDLEAIATQATPAQTPPEEPTPSDQGGR